MWRSVYIFILGALAALGACAGPAESPTRLAQERAFAEICGYAPRNSGDIVTCAEAARIIHDNAPEPCPHSETVDMMLPIEPMLLKQCKQMLEGADSDQFCTDFADKEHRELLLASPPFCGATRQVAGSVALWELGRACTLLADRLPGGAPKIGICIYGMDRNLLPAFELDRSNFDDSRAASQIERQFPTGTPIEILHNVLEAAGFTCSLLAEKRRLPKSGDCSANHLLIMVIRHRLEGAGSMRWKLHWHADEHGRLEKLDVSARGVAL